ncbi:hypothetical protein [Helicobacter sp. T3_23-1059]
MLDSTQRLIKIFARSGLSVSKFANIVQKDRRTVSSWLNDTAKKEISQSVKISIAKAFRYPKEIWECEEKEFFDLLDSASADGIRIIDESYCAGVKYIYENENEGSLIIHPSFPNPAYRDFIVPLVYKKSNDELVESYRKKRGEKMRNYSFNASEWYSIKSLLEFCFSPIGNFYTKEQKMQILELMIDIFRDNLNKSLYFFDSYSQKIYGLDIFYTSINIKSQTMFFKAPMEAMIVEVHNKELIKKLHRHYTNAKECPPHIPPRDAVNILEMLLECLQNNLSLQETCEYLDKNSKYGELFFRTINVG